MSVDGREPGIRRDARIETDQGPEARALLRLLSYAYAEANNLGLNDCATLINEAAGQVQRLMVGKDRQIATLDRSQVH